jgi:hypothetical protein
MPKSDGKKRGVFSAKVDPEVKLALDELLKAGRESGKTTDEILRGILPPKAVVPASDAAATPSLLPPGEGDKGWTDPLDLPLEPGGTATEDVLAHVEAPDEVETGKKKEKPPSLFDNWGLYARLIERIPQPRLTRYREKVLRTLVVYPARPIDPKKFPTSVEVTFENALLASAPAFTADERALLFTLHPRLALAFYTNLIIGRAGQGTDINTARGGR